MLHLQTCRAGNGTRTRDPNLGKVVLYQLSYSRNSEASRSYGRHRGGGGAARRYALFTTAMELRGIEPLTS